MAKVTGGRLAIKTLKEAGVNTIFGLSGAQLEPFFQGCIDEGLRLIDVRHEQAAGLAAEGYARVTGKLGVAMGTAGPGVVNLITSMWNSYECKVPTMTFGGRNNIREFELGSAQELDSYSLTTTITKWRQIGFETRRIAEYVSMGIRQAVSGRPGPVYLEFPWDILGAELEEEEVTLPIKYYTTARPEGDSAMVKQAVELLLKAKKPIVIAGSGVWWSRAEKELRKLIELVKLPLVLTQMARGAVPEDHPLCFGPTRVGTRDADVILLIGTRLNYGLNYGRPGLFSADAKWIQIDIEAEEIGRNRTIDVGITGDARSIINQLIDEVKDKCKGREELPWVNECRKYVYKRQAALEVDMASDTVPIHAARVCREIRDFLDRDAIIAMDGGDATVWAASILRAYEPGHWLDNGPTGTLGVGIPFAMGAKVAKPNNQVLLLHGDGAFGFNAMEFDTMVRHNIPVVCVICNDRAWGMIIHGQEARGADRVIGTKLKETARYDKVVEALGGHGELVEKPDDIRPALERAFTSGKPACINVICASISRAFRRRSTI